LLLPEVAAHDRDRDRAAVLSRLLEPYAHLNAVAAGEVAIGSVARHLGILAATTRRWDDDARRFEDAIAANARMDARPWHAHARDDYARMLLARGEPGDGDRAQELLARAVDT
jgi:hypothetical protein